MTLELLVNLRRAGIQVGAHIGKRKTCATAFFDDGRQITVTRRNSDAAYAGLTEAVCRELIRAPIERRPIARRRLVRR